jgi:hypothetical protein
VCLSIDFLRALEGGDAFSHQTIIGYVPSIIAYKHTAHDVDGFIDILELARANSIKRLEIDCN